LGVFLGPDGHPGHNPRSFARCAADLETAAEQFRPLAHADNPLAQPVGTVRAR